MRTRRAPKDVASSDTSLPERTDRFRRLYEAARSFVFRLTPDGRLRELVPAPDNLMGRPLADWMGTDFMQFVAEPDRARAREMLARVLAGEKPGPFVVRFRTPSGDKRHVEFTVVPDEDEQGRVVGVVGLANGVTLRREAEAKAAHLERLLLASQQITHVGSWEWDKDTGEVVWSDELFRIFGLVPQSEKITIERLLAPLPSAESARAQDAARRSIEEGRPFVFDHEIARPDGQTRTLEVRGEPVRDEGGTIRGLIGTCQDVTERRQRDELILAYLEVGENVPIGLNIWELRPGDPPQPVLVEFNRRARELGARREMLGRTMGELLPDLYATELPALLGEVARTGESRTVERLAVGGRVYSIRVFPVRGHRVGVAFDDVTEHVVAQSALQQAKEELQQLVESVQAIVWRADPAGRFTFVSREAEVLLGYPVVRWLDEPSFWEEHLHPEDREWATSFHARALEQARDHAFEFRMIGAGGQVVWLRDVVRVIGAGGPARECVGVMFNVTSRREAEEDLRRSQRQLSDLSAHVEWAREEERRTISREIHDELGQALTVLKIDLAHLSSRARDGGAGITPEALQERLRDMAELTEDTIDRVRRLARELRPGVLDDLGLEAAIEWQAQEFEARTGIVCRVSSELGDLKLPRPLATAFFRTFQESLTNVARHAGARQVEVGLRRRGSRLTLEVSDDGRGISDEAVAGAKSLGLVGMRERARRLGGQFAISGALGQGTTVTLSVPLAEEVVPTRLPEGA